MNFRVFNKRFRCSVSYVLLASVVLPLALTACTSKDKETSSDSAAEVLTFLDQTSGQIAVPTERPQIQLGSEISGSDTLGENNLLAVLPRPDSAGHMISNQTKFSSNSYGVDGSPRVAHSSTVKKGGGRYQVGKPYTIRGVRYVPKEDANYKAKGLASWYGPNFHGRLTANGEVYDQYGLSAAHPTMPLPSYARVTNLENGSSVIVRVNDRGPFAHNRVIDLSARAAHMLGYTKQGVANVEVEYVGKARMDGLDEPYLVASYNPGSQSLDSNIAQINETKQTDVNTISALEAPDTDNLSLINGFVEQNHKNLAQSRLENMVGNAVATNNEQEGMNDLETVHIGPIVDIQTVYTMGEVVSKYGPVSVETLKDGTYKIHATVAREELPSLLEIIQ